MAAFTHPPVDGRGGRFNRDFGVYYCAADETVAIAESSYHRARFLRESRIDKTTQEMRVIRAQLGPTTLHDVRHLAEDTIYHPDDYAEAQQLGYALRDAKSFGVHFQSVRAKGECYGVMRAQALSDAIHWRYLRYHYDRVRSSCSSDGSNEAIRRRFDMKYEPVPLDQYFSLVL